MVDHAVQTPCDEETGVCKPEIILRETKERVPLFLKKANVVPMERKREVQLPYSAASHFICFEKPEVVADWAAQLGSEEMEQLAGKFLGQQIAGVEVERKESRPPRRVAERHVIEAARIAGAAPLFRRALLRSARHLILKGFPNQPFNGRSLFRLATDDPEQWAMLVQTVLDFVARLMQVRALPMGFVVELLVAATEFPLDGVSQCFARGGPVLGVVSMLSTCMPASNNATDWLAPPAYAMPPSSAGVELFRTRSEPADKCLAVPPRPRDSQPLVRAHSEPTPPTPPTPSERRRCVGTSLHLHDDQQPYSRVSISSWDHHNIHTHDENEENQPAIQAHHLADYWRFAAGGEHRPEWLEARAVEAEAACAEAAPGAEAAGHAAEAATTAHAGSTPSASASLGVGVAGGAGGYPLQRA